MMGITCQKLELNYPCSWEYKLIIKDENIINAIVKDILDEREHSLKPSKQSKGGKFKSYTLELLVHNEDDRKELYKMLGDHEHIKMVL